MANTPSRPQKLRSNLGATLRHPVVVGALLAVFTGVFASLLVPSLTRVWQDRPRELALKRDLVTRISRESTTSVNAAYDGARVSPRRRDPFFDRMIARWRVESAIIGSELGPHFPASAAQRVWRAYASRVGLFLEEVAASAALGTFEYDRNGELLADELTRVYHAAWRRHYRGLRFDDPDADGFRDDFAKAKESSLAATVNISNLTTLLLFERDQIAAEIVESEASGFSHGFWIFG